MNENVRDTEPGRINMDPKATQKRIEDARKNGDKREERDAKQDLRDWRAKGGF